jgi:hypothetical protein
MPEVIQFTVTPSLVVIQRSGHVSAAWEGRLSGSQEKKLLRLLL